VKPIHLNLAARPYRDYRPIYAVVIVTSILIAFLMLNNLDTYVRYVHDTRTTRNEITSIQAQIQQEHRRAETATRDTSTIDLLSLSKEAKFVNTQLAQRAFSWSELLDQLEAVLPDNVRITSISPQFADNGLVHLSLACEGKSPDTLLTTINRFQRDPHFSNPFPTNQESTPSGYRFGLGVDYRPTVMRVVAK
jgi:type IV pilus assembly protein PilN